MAKGKKKPSNEMKNGEHDGKEVIEKPMTPQQIRYLEILKRIEAMNLPPLDLDELERKADEAGGGYF